MMLTKGKLLALAACLAWAALPLSAQDNPRVELIQGHFLGKTPAMSDYLSTHHPTPNAPTRVFPLRKPGSHPGNGGGNGGGGGSTWTDKALQASPLANQYYGDGSVNIDGVTSVGYVPPDTNISVGPTYIVETVNVDYQIYNKSTGAAVLSSPAPIHSIFAAAAGLSSNDICASVDGGDPIVLYDKIDGKWIISQLAYNSSLSDDHFCVAISHGSDPSGSYSAYDFPFGNSLPDYPKLGIWADGSMNDSSSHAGVYFSANMFAHGSRFTGAEMCAFPLSDVASPPSPPSSSITFVCYQNSSSVYSILPADLEGVPGGTTGAAPSGTAEYYLQFSGSNTLNLYQFAPDFTNQTATVSTLPSITVDTFHEACGGSTCVPQPNTGEQLDSLGDRLMYRLSYRNYGADNQSMVVTQSVQDSSSSNQTGVRWYQLTNTGSGWAVGQTGQQQGTFASADGSYYWMGSIAQDKFGDLGIGYSVSSSSYFPGIGFTGRTSTDTPGELEPETFKNIGGGAQTSVSRWGDYSSVSVDPSNDCTFWYANEYLKSTGSYTNWGTYIYSFQFKGCN
jgi:hypothetical protein